MLLLHRAWVEVRYHRRRQRFFDFADKGTKVITLVLGVTLIGQQVQQRFPWVGSAIILVSLLELIYSYSERRQQHKELSEASARLVADIEKVPVTALRSDDTALWAASYALLCANSPPPLKVLKMICEREQSIADGHKESADKDNPERHCLRRFIADFF
ncbi:hypothetical protein [Acidovorax sp. SRB_24]|uniref:hypothetical protein n=1 Tax=Acidovorax sp. SRB_24 TaxID=1962700 RepID=UPI00197C7169|nr:hypothetical protein [Acidovorax sp. SRB_24]